MAGLDLTTAQANLDAAQAAYLKALNYRSAGSAERNVQRQDITALRQEVQHWQREVQRLSRGSGLTHLRTRYRD